MDAVLSGNVESGAEFRETVERRPRREMSFDDVNEVYEDGGVRGAL